MAKRLVHRRLVLLLALIVISVIAVCDAVMRAVATELLDMIESIRDMSRVMSMLCEILPPSERPRSA